MWTHPGQFLFYITVYQRVVRRELTFLPRWVYNKGELRKAGIKALSKGVEDGTVKDYISQAILGNDRRGSSGLYQYADARGQREIGKRGSQANRAKNIRSDGAEPERNSAAQTPPNQLDKSNNDKLNQTAKGAVTFDSEGIKATIHAFEAYEKSPDAPKEGTNTLRATQTNTTDTRIGWEQEMTSI
jgi:hypothetical protein